MKYAFIGTRQPRLLPSAVLDLYRAAAFFLAKQGCIIVSGATPGAEQLAVEAALRAGGKVELYLPWTRYEREWMQRMRRDYDPQIEVCVFSSTTHTAWLEVARTELPNGGNLAVASLALHARCYGMLQSADAVVLVPYLRQAGPTGEQPLARHRPSASNSRASPSQTPILDRGGTEYALRFARILQLDAFDLSTDEDQIRLVTAIRSPRPVSQ